MSDSPTKVSDVRPAPLTDMRNWLRQYKDADAFHIVDELRRDQALRWLRGDRVPSEAYLQLLTEENTPGIGNEHTLEIIYGEFLLRCESEERPSHEEFFKRFPLFAAQLRRVFDLKDKLEAAILTRATIAHGNSTQRPNTGFGKHADSRHAVPVVAGYEIQSELGRGGMGVVYKAREVNLNRIVALKLVQAEDSDLRARFRTEAEAVARVQHPNIVQIFEIGEAADGRPYMALEFVEGGSLCDRLRNTTLPATESASLLETLARAVHFAHLRGILHRDLKPANILLGNAECGVRNAESKAQAGLPDSALRTPHSALQAKVTDFGLAKRLDEVDEGQTRTGAILGTPAYMAPEQAAGQNRDVGVPADVHAIGAILYECLTGRPPFRGRTAMDTLEQVRYMEPIPLSRFTRHIPQDLETICLKCLRKEPEKRYASAEAVADDLRRFLNREPILARRIGTVGRMTRWCRRNPALAGTLAVACIALTVVASVGLHQVLQERARFRQERDQAQTNLYRALLGEARAQMKARETGWWWRAMDNIRDAASLTVPARDPVALRELAIECLGTEYPCFRQTGVWTGHTGPVTSIVCRADGKLAASAGDDGTVRLWSVPDGKSVAVLTGHTQAVAGVAFSPSGHLASCSKDGTVRLWDVATPTTPPRTLNMEAGQVRALVFSPDGQRLVAGCQDGKIRVMLTKELTTDTPTAGLPPGTKTLLGHTGPITCMNFARNGAFVSGGADQTLRFWDLSTAKQTHYWPLVHIPTSVDFDQSPEPAVLIWGDEAARAFEVRHLQMEGFTRLNPSHAGGVTQVRNIPGKWWLSASRDGTVKLWRQISNVRFEEMAVADPEFGPVFSVALLGQTSGVLAGHSDGRISCWEISEPPQRHWVGGFSHNSVFTADRPDLVSSGGVRDFTKRPDPLFRAYATSGVRALEINRVNQLFAFGREDGNVEVWDIPSRQERSRWLAHERPVTSLATSPDGRQLASASLDGTIKLWTWEGKEAAGSLSPCVGGLHSVAWSRDGAYLAASGVRGVVLWDLAKRDVPIRLSEASVPVNAVAFGVGVVAFYVADGAVEVRSVPEGTLRYTLHVPTPAPNLRFSFDGTKLATASSDGTVQLWDMSDGHEIAKMPSNRTPWSGLAFSADDRYLLFGNAFFDLRSKTVVATLVGIPGPMDAAFTADGMLLTGVKPGGVMSVTVAEIELARTKAAGVGMGAAPATGPIRVDVVTAIVQGGHADGIWGVATSPDGRWIATASHDQTVKLWDASTLRLVRTLEGHGSLVWCVAFSPDSRHLASGSGDVHIWEVATGRLLHRMEGHERLVSGLAFHPTKPWLVSGAYDGSVRQWDTSTGKVLGKIHQFDGKPQFDGRVHNVAFRPDGKWLAATADSRVALWEVGDEPPVSRPPDRLLSGHTAAVWAVRFSADGRYLASGSEQGVVMLWDGGTFDRIVTLKGGTAQIRCVSFSRDGDRLSASGYNASTIVWDLAALRRALREMNLDW